MKTSAAGLDKITAREGRRLKAYQDSTGVWTIGVGHTGRMSQPAVSAGMTITAEQSDAFLAADLAPVEAAVNAIGVQLAQNQFDALASLAFNIGVPGFTGSTVVRDLKKGDYAGAADAFLMWEKPPELKTRRESERAQFLSASSAPAPAPAPTKAAPATSDPIVDIFHQLGTLISGKFDELASIAAAAISSPPQAAPQASAPSGSTAAETGIMLKLAEMFLANFSSFAAYATVLPHLATEIPDIVAKAEAAVKGVQELIADIKAGKLGEAANDFQAVFTAIEGILNDVGINLGTVSSTVSLMPQLPSVQGLTAVPALSATVKA